MQSRNAVEGLVLSETVANEEIVVHSEAMLANERIAERKTVVYETRVDPTVTKVAAEKLKDRLFTRFGFLKPKPEETQFVSMDKYYEPYMMISGRYAIDYFRKCLYAIKVDKQVREVILLDHKFEPQQSTDSSVKDHNVITLEGEERIMKQDEASLVLDKSGQDVTLEEIPAAPSERDPKKILTEFGIEEIAENADLDIIRSRIFKRPNDIKRLVKELFEVTERLIIYTPRYRVLYRNLKTGEERTMEFDGVTAERVQQNRHAASKSTLPVPPPPPPQYVDSNNTDKAEKITFDTE
jgi:hypothetical protein